MHKSIFAFGLLASYSYPDKSDGIDNSFSGEYGNKK
jgi:hypothetical protein